MAAQRAAGWTLRHRLRAVVFGGEALDPQMLRPWVERHGDEQPALINMYGITETTVHVTLRRLRATDMGQRSLIGSPLSDLSLYLLDEAGSLVPQGVTGEIHVGGAGVALGYLGRPELTAQRFIDHELAGPGARLYRSGDLARWGEDGELEYLGRRDHQVKLRGYRIELGEVEAALLAQPGVAQALVQVMAAGSSPQLVACVRGQGDALALRKALLARLPEYMVPARIVVMAHFPLTEHGKIDRASLGLTQADATSAATGALDPLEQAIAGELAAALGRDTVDPDLNFFDLGADSLLLIRLHAALKANLQRDFPLVALYRHPGVRSLAAALRGGGPAHQEATLQAAADDAARRAERRRAARGPRPGGGTPRT
jgi:acyl carrier protein